MNSMPLSFGMKKRAHSDGADCGMCGGGQCQYAKGGEARMPHHMEEDPERPEERDPPESSDYDRAYASKSMNEPHHKGARKAVGKEGHKNKLEELQSMKKYPKHFADGGSSVDDDDYSEDNAQAMAMGGVLESGYEPMPMNILKRNAMADMEDDKRLGLHGMAEPGTGDMNDISPMVRKIMMKRARGYSRGGQVANETTMRADFEPNQFDDLVNRDDMEFSYTGANSGDEIGDDAEDEDRKDMVARIMKKRKKQHNPDPA